MNFIIYLSACNEPILNFICVSACCWIRACPSSSRASSWIWSQRSAETDASVPRGKGLLPRPLRSLPLRHRHALSHACITPLCACVCVCENRDQLTVFKGIQCLIIAEFDSDIAVWQFLLNPDVELFTGGKVTPWHYHQSLSSNKM